MRYETTRCIFPLVITCTFYYLVFVSPPYTAGSLILPFQSLLPQYPVPMPYYTSAHASLTLPHTPTIPLTITLSILPLLPFLPFLPVWNPNSWRLVAEGTVPRLSHREIHSQSQLMPSESKSYFVHLHSNFQRIFHYLALLLSVFPLSCHFFLFLSLQLVLSSLLFAILKEITNEYVMFPPPGHRDRNEFSYFWGPLFYR